MNRLSRPPTRVSNACERCRRQKQRCDFERPCQPCLHASTECRSAAETRPVKKLRRERTDSGTSGSSLSSAVTAPAVTSQARSQGSSDHLANDAPRERPHDPAQLRESWNLLEPASPFNKDRGPVPRREPRSQNSAFTDFIGADSAMGITRKIFEYQNSPAFEGRATFSIPGGDRWGVNDQSAARDGPMLVKDVIGIELPTRQLCDKLLNVYFSAVHWFSLVVYEPKFRRRYTAIMDTGLASHSDRGFLLLLLMVLIMGCWYSPKEGTAIADWSATDLESLRHRFLLVVREQFMDMMDDDSLEFVQLCALLGSFFFYHGRPRSSFSILGAATKTSQAMGLHRDSGSRWCEEDTEERKRVWWTIYTWDRFATITYGRPLGINDKDCNVPMPAQVLEDPHFGGTSEPTQICLSLYQTQLNLAYRIASPLLENIYGIRTSHDIELRSQLPKMVALAYQALERWHRDLPPHLNFDYIADLTDFSSTEEQMHKLQALSLQLTYDNLVIVLHRPLLADQAHVPFHGTVPGIVSDNNQHFRDEQSTSFERCLNSALRISRVQHKQNLISLAATTHLVAFIGMNLFTASVVMFICALSDTLSDVAQEAKRGLKRTWQLQKSLSTHASLSMQCGMILEDLIQLVLNKEMEEMLRDPSASNINTPEGSKERDELRQPADIPNGMLRSHFSDSSADTQSAAGRDLVLSEEAQLKQSLLSLQRVFHDNSFPKPYSSFECSMDGRYESHNPQSMASTSFPDGFPEASNFGYHDGNTRMDDLGQFWLWNFDSLS